MICRKNIACLVLTIFTLLQLQPRLKAQEIINFVLVGEEGITEDIKKANSFIVIKKYPGEIFERLDYALGGPLKQLRTYSDSTLAIMAGRNLIYKTDGRLNIDGSYTANQKVGDWRYLDDTGAVVKTERYEKGILTDSNVKDTVKKDTTKYADEREANFRKGMKEWVSYIQKNLDTEAGSRSVKGGRVLIRFIVNTAGKTTGIYLEKSVEFVLDEAAIKVVKDSPSWLPAFQNGKPVNAYRRQPITFVKD